MEEFRKFEGENLPILNDTPPKITIPIICPSCHSLKISKDGFRKAARKKVQRYVCRECGSRFSESTSKLKVEFDVAGEITVTFHPNGNLSHNIIAGSDFSVQESVDNLSLFNSKDITPHEVTTVGQELNILCDRSSTHQINGENRLVTTEQTGTVVVGESPKIDDNKTLLVNLSWWMQKQGYKESTIEGRIKILKTLAKRNVNLLDSESVKGGIAKQEWSSGRKANAVDSYTNLLTMLSKTWNPPKYYKVKKIPLIPTESELDQLISGCGKKTATLLQLLKETGMRIGEAWQIKWNDIDFVTNTVRVIPEKNSEPRIIKLSPTLIGMIQSIKKTQSPRIFGKWLKSQRKLFYNFRRRTASKLNNPRILNITFHTFRHWKATQLYHQTKDIVYVMRFLGHKNIKNTLIYVQLEEALFQGQVDNFVSKAATTIEEVCKLVDSGFEYVCDVGEVKVFRKRK